MDMCVKPEPLIKGDYVALICTSSKIQKEQLSQALKAVEELGYNPVVIGDVTTGYNGYMAGDSMMRAQWVNSAFADKNIKGIFCLRGGDSSSRIMPYLDYDLIKRNSKIFVGYSDVTNLLIALVKQCNSICYHGPMVVSNMANEFDEDSKMSLLECINATSGYEFRNPKGEPLKVLKHGSADGVLLGGNLSLLSASIGTPYSIDGKNRILFIEEVEEPISKIDKWVYHLKNAGIFIGVKGLLLGQFTDIGTDDNGRFNYLKVFNDALKEYDFPIIYNLQCGHGNPNMTLPMGALCKIDTEKSLIRFDFGENS